jgi:hypothetical protein
MRHAVWGAGLGLAVLVLTTGGRSDEFKPEEGFTSLFNGKDLTGWRYHNSKESLAGKTETPDGRMKVQDGVIVMMPKDNKGKGGIRNLWTLASYPRNFHLKLEFRAGLKADSGVYVRGPQLQVRDFVRRREHRHLKKFKNDDWNTLDVIVRNNVLTATLNRKPVSDTDTVEVTVKDGKPVTRLNGKPIKARSLGIRVGAVAECTCNGERLETMTNIPANGPIGLQAEDGKFEFRHIRIRELE